MAEGNALIAALRGNSQPTAAMGSGPQTLNFAWQNNAGGALRMPNRPPPTARPPTPPTPQPPVPPPFPPVFPPGGKSWPPPNPPPGPGGGGTTGGGTGGGTGGTTGGATDDKRITSGDDDPNKTGGGNTGGGTTTGGGGVDPALALRQQREAYVNSDAFNPMLYLATYSDLADAYGSDADAAKKHYLDWGADEGRQATFNASDYLAANPDVRAAFGDDPTAAARHWLEWGRKEGRSITPTTPVATGGAAGGGSTGGGADTRGDDSRTMESAVAQAATPVTDEASVRQTLERIMADPAPQVVTPPPAAPTPQLDIPAFDSGINFEMPAELFSIPAPFVEGFTPSPDVAAAMQQAAPATQSVPEPQYIDPGLLAMLEMQQAPQPVQAQQPVPEEPMYGAEVPWWMMNEEMFLR